MILTIFETFIFLLKRIAHSDLLCSDVISFCASRIESPFQQCIVHSSGMHLQATASLFSTIMNTQLYIITCVYTLLYSFKNSFIYERCLNTFLKTFSEEGKMTSFAKKCQSLSLLSHR